MNTSDSPPIVVRPAVPGDLPSVVEFIQPFVEDGKLLPRTMAEMQELSADGFVAEREGRILGFVALEVYSSKLAEIRSLAVADELQGQGVGSRLVDACIQHARARGVLEVMAITSSEKFFKRCGFDFTLPGEKKALFIQTRDV